MALPVALTIAGSDSSGGAGIQADLKTFAAFGVYGASVITALTAQNTRGVSGIHVVPPAFVTAQIDAVFDDLDVKAIKIGTRTTEAGLEKPKTLLDTTVLIGTDKLDLTIYQSARNICGVEVMPAAEFNAYTVLKQKQLVLTKAAFESLNK